MANVLLVSLDTSQFVSLQRAQVDEEDAAPPDDDLDGMAGALARALAARANVIHQSGQFSLLSLSCLQ